MKVFGTIISDEEFLRCDDLQKVISIVKLYDILNLMKSFRVVNYLGIEFDDFDGYRKTYWEVER